ncbi:MAG: hypothetical protein ACRDTM_08800, partial [Micromonosporaceae bacterium]
MVSHEPDDAASDKHRQPTLGKRLRASEAFADVRKYQVWRAAGRSSAERFADERLADAPAADDHDPVTAELDAIEPPRRRRVRALSLLLVTAFAVTATGYVVVRTADVWGSFWGPSETPAEVGTPPAYPPGETSPGNEPPATGTPPPRSDAPVPSHPG